MTDTPQTVISGVPYPVTAVGDAPPGDLDRFLGDVRFTVDMAGRPYVVTGTGDDVGGNTVRVHEKSQVMGKDVRVWHVTRAAGGFVAEHVAAF